jgi:quercetin dioxygenase-like cupin family protein
MQINRVGNQPSTKGPSEYFTGTVRVDALFKATEPGRSSAGLVTFEPGSRTAWHTHPFGQAIVIVSGCGWVQKEGGPVEEVRPGDTVWFEAGEKHWHGATPTTGMSHIAITELLDGKPGDWLEHVTDEQYQKN